jgi:hypothetical protein
VLNALKASFRSIFVALLCAVILSASPVAARRQDRPPEPSPIGTLSAEAGCSVNRPGGATLSVSWRGSRAGLARQQLDITAHKRGFEQGLFVTLDRIEHGGRARQSLSTRLPATFFRAALDLTATSVTVDPTGAVRVELEGARAGLYYFVRVAGATARAAVGPCINEGEEPRRRR